MAGFLVHLLGGGAWCSDSQVSLLQAELHRPYQGAGLSNPLRFAIRSFCSLSAFCRVPENRNTNGGLLVSDPEEPRAWGPTPQCTLREQRPVTPVCLTSGRAPCSPSLRPVQGHPSCELTVGSVSVAGFPVPIPASSATLRDPRSFCNPVGPEATLTPCGLCPG